MDVARRKTRRVSWVRKTTGRRSNHSNVTGVRPTQGRSLTWTRRSARPAHADSSGAFATGGLRSTTPPRIDNRDELPHCASRAKQFNCVRIQHAGGCNSGDARQTYARPSISDGEQTKTRCPTPGPPHFRARTLTYESPVDATVRDTFRGCVASRNPTADDVG